MTKHERRSRRIAIYRAILSLWFALLLFLSLSSVAFLAYSARYANLIYAGVSIQGLSVGGLSREEALDRLQHELGGGGMPYVSLHTAEQTWTTSSQDLGGYLELDDAVREAWALGRSGSFRRDLNTRLRLLWWGYHIVPAFDIEPGSGLTAMRRVAKQAGHPAQHAQLWVAGLQAHTGESEAGRELDIGATQEAVEARVRESLGTSGWGETPRIIRPYQVSDKAPISLDPIPVPLVFREIIPPLTEIAGSKERVGTILSTPLMLTFDFPEFEPDGTTSLIRRQWCVDQAVLASWLILDHLQTKDGMSLQVDVDQVKISTYLEKIADVVSRPPREARFDYAPETNTLTTTVSGQYGYALDVNAAKALIAKTCLETGALQREVKLPIWVTPPRVSRQDLEALLPLDLIGEGESSFRGSKPGRLNNIHVASARFYGSAVPPNTTFSFLDNLGPVTLANDYMDSWIIYGDRTLLGPGGGVCQVSTTCFRAAFWAGYPILERSPHSYRVSWYEPPVGFDAAVFSPFVDLKFKNDADTPFLILTDVDEQNAMLYFRFYGKSSGRTVTMEGPVISNPVKAGAPVYEEDPSLAPGQRIRVEWAHDGIDVTLDRIIQEGDRVIARERFTSRYEPWPARYRVGPSPVTGTDGEEE